MGGVRICPLSWSVHHNFVLDGRYTVVKWGGRAPTHRHQTGQIFLSLWNVRQKVAIATLCVLCEGNHFGYRCAKLCIRVLIRNCVDMQRYATLR
jgi:hypothetical protein